MATKNKNIGIFILIGAVLLLSSFKNKTPNKKTPSIIDMNGIPTGTQSIYLIPGGIVYNSANAPVYTNNTNSYLTLAVLSDPTAPIGMFNVAYGMDFLNAQTGYVNFEDTTVNV